MKLKVGAVLSEYCPKCGKEHVKNEKYCRDCNTPLHTKKEEETPKKTQNENSEEGLSEKNRSITDHEKKLLENIKKEKILKENTPKKTKSTNNKITKEKPSKKQTSDNKHLMEEKKKSTPRHKFLKLNKKAATVLLVLLTIAIVSTITYEITLYTNSNYLQETVSGSLEFSNKIVHFKLPDSWEKINNQGKNIIGSYQNVKGNSDTILSVYESPAYHKNTDEIINSSINLDKKSGTTSNNYTLIKIDGVQAYDLISTNGTDGYNYRTIGFITNGKEYSFMFVSKNPDMNNSDINSIINSIRI